MPVATAGSTPSGGNTASGGGGQLSAGDAAPSGQLHPEGSSYPVHIQLEGGGIPAPFPHPRPMAPLPLLFPSSSSSSFALDPSWRSSSECGGVDTLPGCREAADGATLAVVSGAQSPAAGSGGQRPGAAFPAAPDPTGSGQALSEPTPQPLVPYQFQYPSAWTPISAELCLHFCRA